MKNNMDKHHEAVKRMHWYILILTLAFLGFTWFIFNNQYDLVSRLRDLNIVKDIGNQTTFKSAKKGSL